MGIYKAPIIIYRFLRVVWIIGISQIHIGDSATIVIPYMYNGSGKIIPYSNLIFDVKLVDIPGYEKP